MDLRAPAGIDDLTDLPDLQAQFVASWNDNGDNGFLGSYVTGAAERSPNYVDPRLEAPATEPVKIAWNGFPRLLSRWFDDELSTERREQAEAAADVVTPIVSWVQPVGGRLRLREAEQHRVSFFGSQAAALARPLRRILPGNVLGPEVQRVRRQQDEYLEWHASRDADGRLVALAFTAEPPDYWTALAAVAPDRVLELYRRLVSPEVERDDLFFPTDLAAFGIDNQGRTGWFNIGRRGLYDELNPWTTTRGIVHLTHRANTLGAEVTLAADASHVLASDSAPPPVGPGEPNPEILRIACGSYGGINRSSDPLIGIGVGGAVVSGARVTLTDPIGLYVATPGISGLTGPQGEPVGNQALRIVRGDDDLFDPRILRFEVRLPEGTSFGLEECTLEGRRLTRGGQVARLTTMHLYAQVYPDGGTATPGDCQGRVCRHPVRLELFTIGDPSPSTPCPDEADSLWLLETPAEPPPAVPPVPPIVDAAAPFGLEDEAELVGVVEVPTMISVERVPGKE